MSSQRPARMLLAALTLLYCYASVADVHAQPTGNSTGGASVGGGIGSGTTPGGNTTTTTTVNSCPITLAGTFSNLGISQLQGQYMQAGVEFAIDLINKRGGITVGNLTCNMSLSIQDDESSPSYAQHLYDVMTSQSSTAFYLSPTTADMTLDVLDLIVSNNSTMFAIDYTIDTSFNSTLYPGIYSPQNRITDSLAAINAIVTSRNESMTAAVFYRNTAAAKAFSSALTGLSSVKTMLSVELTFVNDANDANTFSALFKKINASIDLLIVAVEDADTLGVLQGLALSKATPALAVLYPPIEVTSSSQLALADQWSTLLTWSPEDAYAATTSLTLFQNSDALIAAWRSYLNDSTAYPPQKTVQAVATIDLLRMGLTINAASSDTITSRRSNMSSALQALSGLTTWFGPLTMTADGYNAGQVSTGVIVQDGRYTSFAAADQSTSHWPWVPTPYVANNAFGVMLVFAALVMGVCAVFMALIVWQRSSPIIRGTSVTFCLVTLLGLTVTVSSAIPLSIYPPTRGSCLSSLFLGHWGFSLIYSCLLAKAIRLHKIFNQKHIKAVHLSDATLLKHVAAVMTMQFIYMVVGVSVDPVYISTAVDSSLISHQVCTINQNWLAGLLAGGGLLLGANVILSIRTRTVPAQFNESAFTGFSVYNTAVIAVIVLFLLYTNALPISSQPIVTGFAVITVVFMVTLILFLPRVIAAIKADSNKVTTLNAYTSKDSGHTSKESNTSG